MKTDDLWRRYKRMSDLDARQEIILAYTYLAKYVVDRLLVRPNGALSYDDLLGHAVVGLIDAVERFEPSKGVRFETYAVVRIRGAVLDALKALDWMPRSVRSSEQELKQIFARLEADLGRPATDEEVAAAMGTDVDSLNEMLAMIGQSALLSLEEMLAAGEESAAAGCSAALDSMQDPVLAAQRSEQRQLLAQAIAGLPEKERLVISLYYREGLTLKEIAAVLGVTESRACQLHSKAVIRLHGKLARLEDLFVAA